MADNIATLSKFTKEVEITSCRGEELFLLVKPDTDMDSRFTAWCTDNQEFITVNGWLFS